MGTTNQWVRDRAEGRVRKEWCGSGLLYQGLPANHVLELANLQVLIAKRQPTVIHLFNIYTLEQSSQDAIRRVIGAGIWSTHSESGCFVLRKDCDVQEMLP